MSPKHTYRISKFWQTVILLLSLLLFGNLVVLIATPYRDHTSFLWGSVYAVVCGYTLYKGFSYIIAKLDEKVPWLQNPLKRLFVGLGLQIALLVVVISAIGTTLIFLTTGDINLQLIYQESKNSFFIGLAFTIVATLIVNAIHFFIKWKGAAVNEERLKREALSLQFNALKNQVHPHFLFNSLSALTSMIRNDPEQAVRFVDQLSAVYRYLLEYKDREIIDLKTELAFLDSYIYLYKIRHGDNLDVVYVNMEKVKESVITFSVQMLVENAIKHNEISSDRPLLIEIEYTGDGYIWVKNNLQLRSTVIRGSQLGLENISERYKILSNKDVKINKGPEKFEVGLPLLPAISKDQPSKI